MPDPAPYRLTSSKLHDQATRRSRLAFPGCLSRSVDFAGVDTSSHGPTRARGSDADMPVVVATRGVSPVLGGVCVRRDGVPSTRRATTIRLINSSSPIKPLSSQPRLRPRRTHVPAAIAAVASPTPPRGLGPRTNPFIPLPRRRTSRHDHIERCAKCDALGKSLRSNMRECCWRAAGLADEPSAGRVAHQSNLCRRSHDCAPAERTCPLRSQRLRRRRHRAA